jgi:urease accessory protein
LVKLATVAAGIVHGFAHGTEVPPDVSSALYLLGLVAGTATLHGLGMLTCSALRRVPYGVAARRMEWATGVTLAAIMGWIALGMV